MRATMILAAAVGFAAGPAHAAVTAGPGSVADFAVSVHGNYDLRWALKETGDCGNGTDTALLDGRAFETITYGTPRPVRVHTIWKKLKFNSKPFPFLVLEDRWHGFQTSTDPRRAYVKFQIDVPAVFARAVSGTYAPCGGATQTVSQAGCGKRTVPQFVVALSQEGVTQQLGYQVLTRYGDPYRGTCVIPNVDPAL